MISRYETLVDGDIILRTDGRAFNNGMLYEATFNDPGEFAPTLHEQTKTLAVVNSTRTSKNRSDCIRL